MARSTSERVQQRRETLRQAGLRPIQVWVPDTRRSDFIEAARRQSRLLQDDPAETEMLDWMSSAADTEGWE